MIAVVSTTVSTLGLDAIEVVAKPRAGFEAGFFFFLPPAMILLFCGCLEFKWRGRVNRSYGTRGLKFGGLSRVNFNP
jgi:hypothetical protein